MRQPALNSLLCKILTGFNVIKIKTMVTKIKICIDPISLTRLIGIDFILFTHTICNFIFSNIHSNFWPSTFKVIC